MNRTKRRTVITLNNFFKLFLWFKFELFRFIDPHTRFFINWIHRCLNINLFGSFPLLSTSNNSCFPLNWTMRLLRRRTSTRINIKQSLGRSTSNIFLRSFGFRRFFRRSFSHHCSFVHLVLHYAYLVLSCFFTYCEIVYFETLFR